MGNDKGRAAFRGGIERGLLRRRDQLRLRREDLLQDVAQYKGGDEDGDELSEDVVAVAALRAGGRRPLVGDS